MAAAKPTASAIAAVPASNLCGISFQLVFSTVTLRIMWPPSSNGDMASSSSARPQSAPIPVGPQSLWAVKPTKSAPSAWTSTGVCGAAWAASTTTRAPLACAHSTSRGTGRIVPSELLTAAQASTLGCPRSNSPSSASSASSPSASTGTTANSAPVLPAMYCHGTKFEWCSSSVASTRSPGPRLSSPQPYATVLIAAVTFRVKTISRADPAFTNARTVSRAAS